MTNPSSEFPKRPFSLLMTEPRFVNGTSHALGQLVEHATGVVKWLRVSQIGDDGLEIHLKMKGVDWDAYQIGDLRTN